MAMSIKQQQCLLCYLGYEVDVDGKIGSQTQNAIRKFQKDYSLHMDGLWGPQTEKKILAVISDPKNNPKVEKPTPPPVVNKPPVNKPITGTFWDHIEYFDRSEFKCQCKGRYCNGYPVEPDKKLVEICEKIRKHFGRPVTINSGIRCATHNKNVGGVYNSQHLYGTAADIAVSGVAPRTVAAYVETLIPNSGGIGIYGTFTHVDVRSVRSRWNG